MHVLRFAQTGLRPEGLDDGLSEYVMPYMIQVVREYSTKVDELIQDKIDKQIENKQEELNKEKEQMQQNLYAQRSDASSIGAAPIP